MWPLDQWEPDTWTWIGLRGMWTVFDSRTNLQKMKLKGLICKNKIKQQKNENGTDL